MSICLEGVLPSRDGVATYFRRGIFPRHVFPRRFFFAMTTDGNYSYSIQTTSTYFGVPER